MFVLVYHDCGCLGALDRLFLMLIQLLQCTMQQPSASLRVRVGSKGILGNKNIQNL